MYLDTSAAIPLYALEAESERCESIVGTGDGFVSSELLIGEMTSALLGKERAQVISSGLRAEIELRLEEHIADGFVRLIPLNGMLLHQATEVMRQIFPLPVRTLDAIHLATYLSVDAGPLFTRDRRMREAAAKLGIPLAG
jgi:predicted nucleic acid-binding protein